MAAGFGLLGFFVLLEFREFRKLIRDALFLVTLAILGVRVFNVERVLASLLIGDNLEIVLL